MTFSDVLIKIDKPLFYELFFHDYMAMYNVLIYIQKQLRTTFNDWF